MKKYAEVENNQIIKTIEQGGAYNNIRFGLYAPDEDYLNAGLYRIIDDEPDLTKYQRLDNENYTIDFKTKTITKVYEIIELDHGVIDRIEFKQNRQILLDNLEVMYNEIIYQADEKSRDRITSAVTGMLETDTKNWIAKDNSKHMLTKTDMQNLLRLVGQAQSDIWI